MKISANKINVNKALGASIILVIIAAILIYFRSRNINLVNAFIILATFTAIMINTIATWNLKRLTAKQIAMSIKPVVMCRIEDGNCQVRNVGNGAALYIQSKKIPFVMDNEQRKKMGIRQDAHYIELGLLPCLEKNSNWQGLAVRIFDKNSTTELGIGSKDQALVLCQFDDFTIEYNDIEGAKYKTLLKKIEGKFETTRFL